MIGHFFFSLIVHYRFITLVVAVVVGGGGGVCMFSSLNYQSNDHGLFISVFRESVAW